MTAHPHKVLTLSELEEGREADLFALLAARQPLLTRDNKPYFRVTFRDQRREVSFPIWSDADWAEDCRDHWKVGAVYKLRAILRESNYGPQLEILKIREAISQDAADGYDPAMFLPRSRFDSQEMFAELVELAQARIEQEPLRAMVLAILEEHREQLLTLPAATRYHHAFVGGYLEHVLSVARTCAYLADKYAEAYPDMDPALNKDLVVAGAILHDIGKLRELEQLPSGAQYSAAGHLLGHIVQGHALVREVAQHYEIDPETLLRLEHLIIAHQRLPEWGSPKPPMTPEALIVHYADDLDARFHMIYAALRDDSQEGPVTSKKNALHQHVFRGGV
jgi:3'-5' exoribonuclease